jgi:subtilisin family serine protease
LRRQVKRACATTVATACVVALTAGMTGPPGASGGGAAGPGSKSQAPQGPQKRVTLITGDQVLVNAKGGYAGYKPAKGREHIPVRTRITGGHTFVVPYDAQRLIASGRLDRRLFDITELSKPENLRAHAEGLRVIVGYQGTAAPTARSWVRAAEGTKLRRAVPAINSDAVTASDRNRTALWKAVTRPSGKGSRTTASGVGRIWLDAVRRASLDTSTRQVGAPRAWASGYTGAGVKIAVLDSGVDSSHPDLKGRVVAERNFSVSPDAKDRAGHGTHVASTAAGSGAQSGGLHKGVAPAASVINAKVLDDEGFGEDSGIIAAIDWAVAQGATIVNLSLGGLDTPEIDPLEAHINKVTAEKGVLFAVAAGNSGPYKGTVESPGSADGSLTVGAVDDRDRMAVFSSRGPRTGDGAVKPDLTAPGVDIMAAAAAGTAGTRYLAMSGTSMATPHVAGAAAILKQKNPAWKAPELKAALTGSAKDGGHSPFDQGAGRLQVDRAVEQTVVSAPGSLSYGVQAWPHQDDTPVTKSVTYRNNGTAPVTLSLTAEGTGPDGRPAPAGFFTLSQNSVTVPAGGTASVGVTADTRLGGSVDGLYAGAVIATDGTQSVRTAAAVDREIESYDVTFSHIAPNGGVGRNFETWVGGLDGPAAGEEYFPDTTTGTAKLRLPKGRYVVESSLFRHPDFPEMGQDMLVQPRLDVSGNTTVTLDARTTRPVAVTMKDSQARLAFASMNYSVGDPVNGFGGGWAGESFAGLKVAHVGPEVTDGSLGQVFASKWTKGTSAEYNTLTGGKTGRMATGLTKEHTPAEMARVRVDFASPAAGKWASVAGRGEIAGVPADLPLAFAQRAPGVRDLWVTGTGGARWAFNVDQLALLPGGQEFYPETFFFSPAAKSYAAGKAYTEYFNHGVHGPAAGGQDIGIFRLGDMLGGRIPLFSDVHGNHGWSDVAYAQSFLRGGADRKLYGSSNDWLTGFSAFTVPPGEQSYTLTVSATRPRSISPVSTKVNGVWTFTSKETDTLTMLPASVVRFGARPARDGTVPAGKSSTFPVTVQGPAAGAGLRSLAVEVSYDNGYNWRKLTVTQGKVTLTNPAKGKSATLRGTVTDTKGNTGRITVYDAFFGK